jgi:hypothetical protein
MNKKVIQQLPSFHWKLSFLLSLFIGLLVGMNLLGAKITSLFGISVSVGIFMVPLTFLITDVVEEVYGRIVTQKFLITGLTTLVVVMGFMFLFVALEPAERYVDSDPAYKLIFGQSIRMTFASIVAFLLSQMHDIWAFSFWKKKTKGKYLWLRNNLSTMVSQAIDTLLFMFIAFYHMTPKFTASFIITLAIPYYCFKIAFAAIDTPFVYMGVKWLRKGEKRIN